MVYLKRILALVFLWFLCVPVIYDASAHSMFNSETEKIGGYKMQIATLPEIPNQDEKFQLLFRALDSDDKELEKFRMGVRIYYNDQLVDNIPPQVHTNGHWETDYIFHESGNHIVRVDLYDIQDNGEPLTYTFNVSTLNPFGYAFGYIISSGGIACFGIIIWIIISNKRKMKTRP